MTTNNNSISYSSIDREQPFLGDERDFNYSYEHESELRPCAINGINASEILLITVGFWFGKVVHYQSSQ